MASNPVLSSAYRVSKKAQHVKINPAGIQTAAASILASLVASPYTASSWSLVPLHPIPSLHPPTAILDWIFLVSSLNFSFWSALPASSRYGVRWKAGADGKGELGGADQVWTGYWSLLAALHRAQEEGINITEPAFYRDCDDEVLRSVFRSDQGEEIPLLEERIRVMREVGTILCQKWDGSYANLLTKANGSALALVELVVDNFPCYDDRTTYTGEEVLIRKRAQILVAETWAAFEGTGPGHFRDIDQLTMFADYRVPQILHSLSTITYSPHLVTLLASHTYLVNGSPEEVEIRALSIVAVEEIRLEIARLVTRDSLSLEAPNPVLLDFLLWDLAKVEEAQGRVSLPHHRTRSIFY